MLFFCTQMRPLMCKTGCCLRGLRQRLFSTSVTDMLFETLRVLHLLLDKAAGDNVHQHTTPIKVMSAHIRMLTKILNHKLQNVLPPHVWCNAQHTGYKGATSVHMKRVVYTPILQCIEHSGVYSVVVLDVAHRSKAFSSKVVHVIQKVGVRGQILHRSVLQCCSMANKALSLMVAAILHESGCATSLYFCFTMVSHSKTVRFKNYYSTPSKCIRPIQWVWPVILSGDWCSDVDLCSLAC